jgi:quinate dehydrogenase
MGSSEQARSLVYFAGGVGSSSIAIAAHDYISQCLGKDWKMTVLATASLDEVVQAFRAPQFAGGIITMPFKKTIIPYLDEVDDLVATTGACNVVYLTAEGRLRGTNTDWVGIKNALLSADPLTAGDCAMIYGAGGASRAAVYALSRGLGYENIYVVNRDDQEVADLIEDTNNYTGLRPNIVHIRTLQQAQSLPSPDYIVSTIPDFPARTPGEINARAIVTEFLSRRSSKLGVLLDMCYHPLLTENLQLARHHGWVAAEGVQVVGHQLKDMWKLWTGNEITEENEAVMWELLQQAARNDPTVAGMRATASEMAHDLHSLPSGSRPIGVVRNNGPDLLTLERYKLRELAEGWPLYR